MPVEEIYQNNKLIGVCIGKSIDSINYLDNDGMITELSLQEFNERCKLEKVKRENIPNWILTFYTRKKICQEYNLPKYSKLLSTTIVKLTIIYLTVKLEKTDTCCICLDEFSQNSRMISFHPNHQKHICCLQCFCHYRKIKCPICNSYHISYN